MTVSKVTEGESGRRILGVVAAARIAVVAGSIEKEVLSVRIAALSDDRLVFVCNTH